MTTGSIVDHIRRRIRHAIPDHSVNTAHIFCVRLRGYANFCERKLQHGKHFGDNLCQSLEF
jgi:hypothetical protein